MLLISEYFWRFFNFFYQIDTTVLIMKKKYLKVLNLEIFCHNIIIIIKKSKKFVQTLIFEKV